MPPALRAQHSLCLLRGPDGPRYDYAAHTGSTFRSLTLANCPANSHLPFANLWNHLSNAIPASFTTPEYHLHVLRNLCLSGGDIQPSETTLAPTRNVYIAFRMRCASKKLQMIEKKRTPHFETLAILRPFFVIFF